MKKLKYIYDLLNYWLVDYTHGSESKSKYRKKIKIEFYKKYRV